jgi:dTDP-4-dehydrorhamnose 3,5-epimerase
MQAKLVFVIKGKIQDIVLDIDKNSKTFGRYYQFILREKDKLLYIPKKFAHGYCALEKSEIIYVLDKNYKNENQHTIKWDDKDLNIKWMTKKPIISNKDKNGKKFNSI